MAKITGFPAAVGSGVAVLAIASSRSAEPLPALTLRANVCVRAGNPMGVALTVTLCPFATGVNELVFSVTVNVTGEPGLRLTGEGGENEQDTSVGGVGQPSATGPEKVVVERVNDAGPLGFPETAETKLG